MWLRMGGCVVEWVLCVKKYGKVPLVSQDNKGRVDLKPSGQHGLSVWISFKGFVRKGRQTAPE
jgi:hypothetical protein